MDYKKSATQVVKGSQPMVQEKHQRQQEQIDENSHESLEEHQDITEHENFSVIQTIDNKDDVDISNAGEKVLNPFKKVPNLLDVQTPKALKNILLKQIQTRGVPNFQSLRAQVTQLADILERLMQLQIIPRVRETNFNISEIEQKLRYTPDSDERYREDVEYIKNLLNRKDQWNGVGGVMGFAEFIMNDYLVTKQKPLFEIEEWIKELGQEEQKFRANIGKKQKKDDRNKGATPDVHDPKAALSEMIKNLNVDFESIQERLEGLQKHLHDVQSQYDSGAADKGKAGQGFHKQLYHHELDMTQRQYSGFDRNLKLYQKCNSKNVFHDSMKVQDEDPNDFTKYMQRKTIPYIPNSMPKLISECDARPHICEPNLLEGLGDPIACLPQPLPFHNEELKELEFDEQNEKFALQQFSQRNISMEPSIQNIPSYRSKIPQGIMKTVVTLDSLDQWYADTIDMHKEKYQKKRKKHNNDNAVQNKMEINIDPELLKPDKNPDEEEEQDYQPLFKKILTEETLLEKINKERRNNGIKIKEIKNRTDLKPKLYAKFEAPRNYFLEAHGAYGVENLPAEIAEQYAQRRMSVSGSPLPQQKKANKPCHPSKRKTTKFLSSIDNLRRQFMEQKKKERELKHTSKEYDQDSQDSEESYDISVTSAEMNALWRQEALQANSQNEREILNEFGGFKNKLIEKLYTQKKVQGRQDFRKARGAAVKHQMDNIHRLSKEEVESGKLQATIFKQNQKDVMKKLLKQNEDTNEKEKDKRRENYLRMVQQNRQQVKSANMRTRNGQVRIDRTVKIRKPEPYTQKQTLSRATKSQQNLTTHQKSNLMFKQQELQTNPMTEAFSRLQSMIERNAIAKNKDMQVARSMNRLPMKDTTQSIPAFGINVKAQIKPMTASGPQKNSIRHFNKLQSAQTRNLQNNLTYSQKFSHKLDEQSKSTAFISTFDHQQNPTNLFKPRSEPNLQIPMRDRPKSEMKNVGLKKQLHSEVFHEVDSSIDFTHQSTTDQQDKDQQAATFDQKQILINKTNIAEHDFDELAVKEDLNKNINTPYKNRNDWPSPNRGKSEAQFYSINKTVRGKSVTAQNQQYLRETTQIMCFNDQRIKFKGDFSEKPDFGCLDNTRSSVSIHRQKMEDDLNAEDTKDSRAALVKLPTNETKQRDKIMKVLKRDNFLDVKNPFIQNENDKRVYKIGLFSNEKKPPDSLRKRSFEFKDKEFWYLKGADDVQYDSQIDSYKWALDICPTYYEVMHNLACVYEKQQRFDLAIKWFDMASQLDPDNTDRLETYYGLALCYVKSGQPQMAIDKITVPILLQADDEQKMRKFLEGKGTIPQKADTLEITQRNVVQIVDIIFKDLNEGIQQMGFDICRAILHQVFNNVKKYDEKYVELGKKQPKDEDFDNWLRSKDKERNGQVDKNELKQQIFNWLKIPEAARYERRSKEAHKNFHFKYLRSICHRIAGNFEKATQDYMSINRVFALEEGKKIVDQIFAMIIMPNEENRKKQMKFIEQFRQIIDRYEVDKDRKILSKYYIDLTESHIDKNNRDKKWLDKSIFHVMSRMQNMPFFRRFSYPRIREIMDQMTMHIFSKDNLVFFEPDKVYVIVTGSILMKSHHKQMNLPETHAKFGPGAILNYMQEGQAIFYSYETWFVCQVDTEMAVFDKSYFTKLWEEDLLTHELRLRASIIRCYPIFKNISELQVIALASELIEFKNYKKGDVIRKQSECAPTSEKLERIIKMHQHQHIEKKRSKKSAQRRVKKTQHGDLTNQNTSNLDQNLQTLQDNENSSTTMAREGSHECYDKFNTLATMINKSRNTRQTTPGSSIENQQLDEQAKQLNQQAQNVTITEHYRAGGNDSTLKTDDDLMSKKGRDNSHDSNENSLSLIEDTDDRSKIENMNKSTELPFEMSEDYGIFIIIKGKCAVVNRPDNYQACVIQGGEIFGESDILKIVGYDFFGDIVAETSEVECMFISQRNLKMIPDFELQHIIEFAKQRVSISQLGYMYSKKYEKPAEEYLNYYQ